MAVALAEADAAQAAPARKRRLLPVLSVLAVLAALAWALIAYRIKVVDLQHRHLRLYTVLGNGDHMYYASMMLQFSGTPYGSSLQQTASHLNYPLDWHNLNYGYLDPRIAPLIYPRPALPLFGAIFRPLLGVNAIQVPGILAALAMPLVLLAAARRLRVTRWLLGPLLLLLLSTSFAEFGAGIYTEALMGLFIAGAAAVLPWDGRRTSLADLAWLSFLVTAGGLTRQLAPAFAGLAVGALIWGLVFRAGRRQWWRAWRLPAGLVTGLATVVTVLVQWWAPYNVLPWVEHATGATTASEGLLRAVLRIPHVFNIWLPRTWHGDPLLIILLVAGILAAVLVFREPLVGGVLGVAVFVLLTVGINGYDPFRYIEPVYPLFVLLVAMALRRITRAVRVGTPTAAPLAADGAVPAGTRRPLVTGLARGVAVVVPVALAVALVSATVVAYLPSRTVSIGSIDPAGFPRPWPLTVASLDLRCGGDNGQVWATTPAGQRLSVTGTAMARSPGTPSVVTVVKPGKVAGDNLLVLVYAAVRRCPQHVPLPPAHGRQIR